MKNTNLLDDEIFNLYYIERKENVIEELEKLGYFLKGKGLFNSYNIYCMLNLVFSVKTKKLLTYSYKSEKQDSNYIPSFYYTMDSVKDPLSIVKDENNIEIKDTNIFRFGASYIRFKLNQFYISNFNLQENPWAIMRSYYVPLFQGLSNYDLLDDEEDIKNRGVLVVLKYYSKLDSGELLYQFNYCILAYTGKDIIDKIYTNVSGKIYSLGINNEPEFDFPISDYIDEFPFGISGLYCEKSRFIIKVDYFSTKYPEKRLYINR